jgi:hypothetical protein
MTPNRLPPVDEDLMRRSMALAEKSAWESERRYRRPTAGAGDGALSGGPQAAPRGHVLEGAPMTQDLASAFIGSPPISCWTQPCCAGSHITAGATR